VSDSLRVEAMSLDRSKLAFEVARSQTGSTGGEMAKNHGSNRGKVSNEMGTHPRRHTKSPASKPGTRAVESGPGRGLGRGKHAAKGAQGAKTSQTRKAGPNKTPRGTTTRSGDN
jgi:hypothetical protein